jgi:polysaccharide export outer membrane protein
MKRLPPIHFLVLAVALLTGCVPQRDIVYFQGKLPSFSPADSFRLQIRNGDQLAVNVFTTHTDAFPYFSPPGERAFGDSRSAYEKSYLVRDSGTIALPLIGAVKLEGLQLREAESLISSKLRAFFDDPVVSVKKLDYRVTVLGEVNRPGLYTVTDERITLPELLGMAGDLTQFGDRKTIRIIRTGTTGAVELTADLTDAASLNGSVYFLHPDDVVYVSPVRRRAFQNTSGVVLLFTSILTTAAVLVTAMVAVNK